MTKKSDFSLPFNDLTQYVPQNLKNPMSSSLLDNLFNRFMSHDESVPLYGYIGTRPSNINDKTPRVPQPTIERDINAIVPVISFNVGAEKNLFTFSDLLNRANAIGVSDDLSWLYSQGNNFVPPIDLDKFTNFFNYYWFPQQSETKIWNPDQQPEYYVIAKPGLSDQSKLNVNIVSDRPLILTGTGFHSQQFLVTFISPTNLLVQHTGSLGDYQAVQSLFNLSTELSDLIEYKVQNNADVKTLLSFRVVREEIRDANNSVTGYSSFESGDSFTIDAPFLSKNYTVTFTGSEGIKGKITSVKSLSDYQIVARQKLVAGNRILIKDNGEAENGIYIVGPRAWVRAPDFTLDTGVDGSLVYVTEGDGKNILWRSSRSDSGSKFIPVPNTSISNTNDWQEGNFWVKGEDLRNLGISRAGAIQAVRPIIEFNSHLELNSFVKKGLPSDTGSAFSQKKSEFNQIPMFNLYRYDGTHSGKVSSVFFYQEDPTSSLDLSLQKRLKHTTSESADFVFSHGCNDDDGSLLFFKLDSDLKTVWSKGYIQPFVSDVVFNGQGNGTIFSITPSLNSQQQVWTLTCISPTAFSVVGSKLKSIPILLNVGQVFDCGEFVCVVESGSVPFEVGDNFKFTIGNLERPRYVFKNAEDGIEDLYGGFTKDNNKVGAYQVSRSLINNPYNDSTADIDEGSAYSHFRSILSNQIGDTKDYAFGGNIKLWGEQQTLLASLLMQKDLTPTSMISFAQQEYEQALSSVKDIFTQQILSYLTTTDIPTTDADIDKLVDFILLERKNDYDVKTVLFDSTSPVVGFPATLPMLGILDLVTPAISFDKTLNLILITHHDGHKSPLNYDTFDFRQSILGRYIDINIKRSDGTETPAIGSFSTAAPLNPYKGELWINPDNNKILVFNVTSDDNEPINPQNGDYWFDHKSNILYLRFNNRWAGQASSLPAWKEIDFAEILNAIILKIETRLFNGINAFSRKYDFSSLKLDTNFNDKLKAELFAFAAINNYDPLAPKYNPSDAFTWNYSQATFINMAAVGNIKMPARWNNLITAHQRAVLNTQNTTERPDLEPWKLLGFNTYSDWKSGKSVQQAKSLAWKPEYESYFGNKTVSFIDGGTVVAVSTFSQSTVLEGLPTVDGVLVADNQLILLQNENDPAQNGIWRVSPYRWVRGPQPLIANTMVTVVDGTKYKNTKWALVDDVDSDNTGVRFEPIRRWSSLLWSDIEILFTSYFKTSVNSVTDELLPPYVSPDNYQANNAITITIPPGAALGYDFGEEGPVESVWRKSIDYGYGLARALFKTDPLAFLGFCWGFNWVEIDGILYDGDDMQMPGHKRFKLHGDPIKSIDRQLTITQLLSSNSKNLSLVYDGYGRLPQTTGSSNKMLFSIRDGGVIIGYAEEGVLTTFNSAGNISFTLEDNGVPFKIGDTFNINIENNQTSVTFVPAKVHNIQGFGQIFTQALRAISVSTEDSYAINAFKNWEINMGYRASGLVGTDDLRIYTDTDTLANSSYSLLFKKNERARSEWVQALRIQLMQVDNVHYDNDGLIYPNDDAETWLFRIEGYNPRHIDISYYEMSTVQDPVTFNALAKSNTDLEWLQPTLKIKTISTHLPLMIRGVQNVINMLFGYADYLQDNGWEFNKRDKFNIDAATGRKRSMQLEIEKFVDACFGGIKLGQGTIINPFMDKIWINHDKGLLSKFGDEFIFDVDGNPGIYDALGVKINNPELNIIRTNTISEISSSTPIYSAHVQIDEFEHIFVFNNYAETSKKSGLLYDPFSGSRVITYKINGRRQADFSMRPEFGGHYLVGDQVRQNLQASSDNVSNFYNTNTVFENETTTRHALALLGFNTKSYFDNLDISSSTQFNFWRGLVQSKGTLSSIAAYLNNDRFDDAKIDEYWAYKVAEYGDSRQKIFPELKLSVADSLQQFTKIQFDPMAGPRSVFNPAGELPGFTIISSGDETRWFSIDDMNLETYFAAEPVGQFTKQVNAGDIITLPFIADRLVGLNYLTKINSNTLKSSATTVVNITGYGPATPRYNPVKLFNYADNELVEEITVWNPAAGIHNPNAIENVNIISNINPAKYNYSTQVLNNNSYDPLRSWGTREIGRVWLDTRNLDYIPYYDDTIFPDVDERLNRWGTLTEYATMDVYEWIRSTVKPSEYNAKAIEDAGNSDIDPSIRAAGVVADPQTYKRSRAWGIYPVAWSYSPLLVEEGHPAFNSSFESAVNFVTDDSASNVVSGSSSGASFIIEDCSGEVVGYAYAPSDTVDPLATVQLTDCDGAVLGFIYPTPAAGHIAEVRECDDTLIGYANNLSGPTSPTKLTELKLFLDGGTIWLEDGSFADFGITAGMRIGAWDPNPDNPRPLSEMVIRDSFFKKPFRNDGDVGTVAIEEQSKDGLPASVKISIAENSVLQGQVKFSAQPVIPIQREGVVPPVWDIPVRLVVTEVDSGQSEIILLNTEVGTEYDIAAVPSRPAIPAIPSQPAIPAQPAYLSIIVPGGISTASSTGIEKFVIVDGVGKLKNYTTTISIDGSNYLITCTSDDVQTWGGVKAVIDSAVGRSVCAVQPVTYKTSAGNIVTENQFVINGASTNVSSAGVRIVISGFFAEIMNVYKYISQASIGVTPPVEAQPAIEAQNGTPAFYTDVYHGAKIAVTAGQQFTFEAPLFKLTITVNAIGNGVFDIDAIQKAIVSTLGAEGDPIVLKDAVEVDIIVPLGDNINVANPSVLSNNIYDEEYAVNNGIGWRAWSIPTQEELDTDGIQPNSAWKPYVGPLYNFVNGDATIDFVRDAMKYISKPLTLNDGTVVPRYNTSWEEWDVVNDIKLSTVNSNPDISTINFVHTDVIDPSKTSIYVNGISQLRATYTIVGKNISVLNVKSGSKVVVIIRKYEPRAEELAFNPDVQENFLYQHQYKKDYEYVSSPIRNDDGSISNIEYFFWVKNKSTAAAGKKMSVKAVAQDLISGPSSFITFQNILESTDILPNRYNAITISGLNFVVTKDNSFKLRFTRNFTLRDDPQDLDLKDTHTEWSLMRQNQNTKVPVQLWNKLIDSAAGFDAVGNIIPSIRRTLYDERNGTRTQFGFNVEQTLAPFDLLRSSILYTILNTKLVNDAGISEIPDYIDGINFDESSEWFADSNSTRKIMTFIWLNAKVSQINEIFFAALNDILASNYELSDIFKTSRLSAYSIKLVPIPPGVSTYE